MIKPKTTLWYICQGLNLTLNFIGMIS